MPRRIDPDNDFYRQNGLYAPNLDRDLDREGGLTDRERKKLPLSGEGVLVRRFGPAKEAK